MIRTSCRFVFLITLFCLATASAAFAQTLSITHSFDDGTVSDAGRYPFSALVVGGDANFYGTTVSGGAAGYGTVFKITPTGTETILHSFNDGSVQNDGYSPYSALVVGSDGNLYGMTQQGGTAGQGTVYKITPTGTETVIHNFNDGTVRNDGFSPMTDLLLGRDGNFYGTTISGGTAGDGTVFKITPTGTETILHSFNDGSVPADGNFASSLIQTSDGTLYGTTQYGGIAGGGIGGTVFKITPSGAEVILHAFGDGTVPNDGNTPSAALFQGPDGNFYGTTTYGGTADYGTVFEITPTGSETNIHNFGGSPSGDGAYPDAALTAGSDGNLYGTTSFGGSNSGTGTVFRITLAGTVTILHTFSDIIGVDGSFPNGPLVLGSDGDFYGTTQFGGVGDAGGLGTVFKITPSGAETLLQRFGQGTSSDDGFGPNPLLLGSDGNFYGTTERGGTFNGGVVFKVTLNGDETVLYDFQGSGGDGFDPDGALVQGQDGNFYGTTFYGGSSGHGTVFQITPGGTETVLHRFGDGTVQNDGANPSGALIAGGDGDFYGTTAYGGSANTGTVFKISPTGAVTILHSFGDGTVQNDGIHPFAALILGPDGAFYGATEDGGAAGDGTVFKITPTGAETVLHSFNDGTVQNDGSYPDYALVLGNDGNFYGTTSGLGTVFEITPSGTETVVHAFTGASNDVFGPQSALLLGRDGNFYGTSTGGGMGRGGTVYKVTPAGTVTVFHSFLDGTVQNDGSSPGSLVLNSGGTFYGTTFLGGSADAGTVFALSVPNGPSATLTRLSPNAAASGSVPFTLTVTGTGFASGAVVKWNAISLTTTFVSATQLTASVPADLIQSTGMASVTVVNPGAAFSNALPFTIFAAPTITSFTPTSGPVGTVVTITGTRLTFPYAVQFNGASATVYSSNATGTQLTVTVPAGAVSGYIAVFVNSGIVESPIAFTVTTLPTITSFTPTSGPVGTVVTLTGTGLTGVTRVRFHNATAVTYSVNAQGTQLTVTVPTGAATGTITVNTPGGAVTSTQTFTVTVPPTITSFTPTTGPMGTVVTITGTNFTGATSVKFNGTAATTFTVASATSITATVPASATTGTIAVTTPGGTATSAGTFTGTPAPTITSFAPTSGAVGTTVVINGTGFVPPLSIVFNGNASASGSFTSTKITVTVPSGAITGKITVTTANGTVMTATNFTVTTDSAPTITSISPPSAAAGTVVTITGTNLTGATSITVGGVSVPFTVVNGTTLTFTVPAGLAGGTIVVTTPGGTVSSSVPLVVLTWTAGAVGAGPSGTGRILWNRSDGAAGLWVLNASDSQTAVGPTYGPYPGWSATALATASDGTSRVLWVNVNGSASVWTMNAAGVETTEGPTYAPPGSGWTAKSVGVASDGTARVLWTTTGSMQVWSFNTSDVQTGMGPVYGPISGWSAASLSTAPDGTSRVLWDRSDGAAGVWSLGVNDAVSIYGTVYGPYSGWTAKSIGASGDGTSRVLWTNVNGDAGVWSFSASDVQTLVGPTYGPYPGWTAGALAAANDGTCRVLWNRSDRSAGVWSFGVNDVQSVIGTTYGPY